MVVRPAGAITRTFGVGNPSTEWEDGADGLFGRARELVNLQAAIDEAAAGRPAIVLLVGEAGIGKTRLADRAAVLARDSGMRVLRGEGDAAARGPMELWRGVFRALRMVPTSDPSLPAQERRWEQLESLVDALQASAPAAVFLEDLHWADAIAVWVLERLPRALGDAKVVVVATTRDREPDMPGLDGLRRVSRVVSLGGLDVDAVRQLAGAEDHQRAGPFDAVDLHARTGGNPLFVQELIRSPDGSGVIGEVLRRSLDRFDGDTRQALSMAATAGAGTALSLLASACSCPTEELARRLEPAHRGGVLAEVSADGVRFRHALLAETAERLADPREQHHRLATAWDAVGGVDGSAAAAAHRLRAADGGTTRSDAVRHAREVAAELVTAGQQSRAAGLLWQARGAAADGVEDRELRANVTLDLAEVLSWLGDMEPALTLFQEAAELARGCPDPVTRARAEVGANLWVSAFVPDLPRMRRLEDALEALPPEERHLRARLLGRLTIVGGADVDAIEQVRAWADESVTVARSTGDPVLIAQTLLDQTQVPTTRVEFDTDIVAAQEVVRLAEHAGRSDLALYGHQRCAGHHLNHADIGAASQSLGHAEVLAALLPSPGWRQSTLVQRTTLLALNGSRAAAAASMYETVRVGTGHIEPVVVLGCEAIHQLMLFDLYGHPDPRAEEIHRITVQMLNDVPSPVFQVQKGFGAQLFGDEADVQDVLHRYGSRPDRLSRSMTGDHLLRVFGDTVARAGAVDYARPAYRALLPYTGLLNVGGGHSAGLPVDDVLGRLAALDGDLTAAVVHARDAVALARAMPSPPLLVHCLDHLADHLQAIAHVRATGVAAARSGDRSAGDVGPADEAVSLRAEADLLAAAIGVRRPGRDPAAPAASSPGASAEIVRDGDLWILSTPLGNARLPDSTGIAQLARLLRSPRTELTAVELSGRSQAPVGSDLGPAIDARAKREYRRRMHELQAEVDDAEAAHDPVRAEQAQVEREALLRELKRAVGIGGRDRPTGSDAERARVNVARSLRRTITSIARQAPVLGAHLDQSVRTGRYCLYLPEPVDGLIWTVRSEPAH
jgi:hypothetical protein